MLYVIVKSKDLLGKVIYKIITLTTYLFSQLVVMVLSDERSNVTALGNTWWLCMYVGT
jgi:hypothetical protein